MSQNRNKLIKLLIGNLSNSVVHRILEKSIDKEELTDKYRKEFLVSFELAKRYREKINPLHTELSQEDINHIRRKVITGVKSELNTRISKGYKGIVLDDIELEVDRVLNEINGLK